MTQYAKFISETQVKYPPKKLVEQDFVCFNFDKASPEILNSRGYYEVIEDEIQECPANCFLRPTYELCSETIEEENEEGYMVDVNERIDNSYIECTYVAEEIVDEGSDD